MSEGHSHPPDAALAAKLQESVAKVPELQGKLLSGFCHLRQPVWFDPSDGSTTPRDPNEWTDWPPEK